MYSNLLDGGPQARCFRFGESHDQIHVKIALLSLVLFSGATAFAEEISWITGVSGPGDWSIQPEEPRGTDVIRFSGGTHTYANACLAESGFGGKPVLYVDPNKREVRLVFTPPPSDQCDASSSPVCGLQGSFGPLATGSWVFFSTQGGVFFSVPFEVSSGPRRTVYYVDSRAAGSGSGSNWADAFVYLQSALAVAAKNSEIRVAQGVYRPSERSGIAGTDPSATFELKSGVLLKGGYAGIDGADPDERDIGAYETILSGDLRNNDDPQIRMRALVDHPSRLDNCYQVVTAIGEESAAILDGFTIQGGHAFGSSWVDRLSCGGGIYIEKASLTVRDCMIVNNAAAFYGGGVYSRGVCTPTFTGCVIADNWSNWRGGGIYRDWASAISLSRCLVSGNGTGRDGGGISNHSEGELVLSNCVLSGNVAAATDTGLGGALYCFLASVRADHCTFEGNVAARGPTLACTSSGEVGASDVRLRNCILWDAPEGISNEDGSTIDVVYSDVQGDRAGQGNFDKDPGFLSAGRWNTNGTPYDPSDDLWQDGDYRLAYESPCVDAGDPNARPAGGETDVDDTPRLIGPVVDMGAYELFENRPVANAGPDVTGFSLDGKTGVVTLDGSNSRDPLGLPLYYQWFIDTEPVSSSARFTIALPVGQHTLTLLISNSDGLLGTDEAIAVVTAAETTVALVSPDEIDRSQAGKAIIAMVVMPAGKGPADFDIAEPMVLFPGEGKAQTQTTLIWLDGRVFAMARFDSADLLAAVPQNGLLELRIVGRLKTGHYFTGVDTIRIK